MPRRKKKIRVASEPHSIEKTEVEASSSGSVKRKRRVEDAFIVISDSESEEPKEENGLQNTKTKLSTRAKGLAKRKIAQMTEEEQFELALQMSEQEARAVNSQEEEEEALLRKAIAESLNSCRPLDPPATISGPLTTGPSFSQSHQENTTDSGTAEGKCHLGPPSLFKGFFISQGNKAEDREEPWDHPESTEEEPGSGISGTWEQSHSPVFENGNANCADRCTGYLTEHTACGKPQESTGKGSAYSQSTQGRGHTARPCRPVPPEANRLQDAEGTVHYFWGVPFCPAGVDPNQYTKVILCQLEVYQKSLKMAQRQLLRKKEFGDPVLPSPPLIQRECVQGDQASEQKEGSSEDAVDEDTEARQETRAAAWHAKPTDFRESPVECLQEKLLLEKEQPTMSHGQSSQGLFVEESSEEGNSVPASQSIATLPRKRSSVLRPEGSAEEITVCPETQLSSTDTLDLEREVSPGIRETPDKVKIVMTNKEVGSGADAEKKACSSSFLSSIQVSCPLCDQGFPPAKIELHAMYCNGLVEQKTVLTRRQKEARNRSLGEPSNAENEKCYLCKAQVPFQDYHGHVMACLRLAKKATSSQGEKPRQWQRPGNSAANSKQPPPRCQVNPKEKGRSEGRLFLGSSLLEQSEHQTADTEVKVKSSGEGTCRVRSSGMEEAGCSRERSSSLAPLSLNESPIKSFVPISEATDCLVDFKKQLAFPPGSQPRTKSARGRRKKS